MLCFSKCLKSFVLCLRMKRGKGVDQTSGHVARGLDPPAGDAVLLLSHVMHHAVILINVR